MPPVSVILRDIDSPRISVALVHRNINYSEHRLVMIAMTRFCTITFFAALASHFTSCAMVLDPFVADYS